MKKSNNTKNKLTDILYADTDSLKIKELKRELLNEAFFRTFIDSKDYDTHNIILDGLELNDDQTQQVESFNKLVELTNRTSNLTIDMKLILVYNTINKIENHNKEIEHTLLDSSVNRTTYLLNMLFLLKLIHVIRNLNLVYGEVSLLFLLNLFIYKISLLTEMFDLNFEHPVRERQFMWDFFYDNIERMITQCPHTPKTLKDQDLGREFICSVLNVVDKEHPLWPKVSSNLKIFMKQISINQQLDHKKIKYS